MRRVKLCCVILAVIVALSVGSIFFLDAKCDRIFTHLSSIQDLYENDKTAEALEETEELSRLWDQTYKILSILVKNDKLSDINAIMARVRPLIQDNSEEVGAELESAAFQLNLIRNTELPYLYNIF